MGELCVHQPSLTGPTYEGSTSNDGFNTRVSLLAVENRLHRSFLVGLEPRRDRRDYSLGRMNAAANRHSPPTFFHTVSCEPSNFTCSFFPVLSGRSNSKSKGKAISHVPCLRHLHSLHP